MMLAVGHASPVDTNEISRVNDSGTGDAKATMTVGRTIDYEALSQDAMRSVVRTIMVDVAKHGLPGDHHFYISFDTTAAGTLISKRLLEKYPDEMTIVLQHRFWDLLVTPELFEVKLTFDGIPERLVVPFTSIRVFFDPSVRYGLQFEAAGGNQPSDEPGDAGGRSLIVQMGQETPRGRAPARKPRAPRKPRIETAPAADATAPPARGAAEERAGPRAVPDATGPATPSPHVHQMKQRPGRPALTQVPPAAAPTGESPTRQAATSASETAKPAAGEAAPAAGAQVLSLDSFRKK